MNGKYIEQQRKLRKLTLIDIERRSGVSYATVHRLENNVSDPRISTILLVAEALKIEPIKFLKGYLGGIK